MPKSKNLEPCGIIGIHYTKEWLRSIGVSWPHLVGSFAKVNSLHLPDTKTFESIALVKESPMRDWVEKYLSARLTGFDHPTNAHRNLKGNWTEQLLNDPVSREVLQELSPPQIGIKNVTADNLTAVSTLWYIIQCMKAVPRLCEKSEVLGSTFSLDPYDVLHMHKFLSHCNSDFRGKSIDEFLSKKKNLLSKLPKYADTRKLSATASSSASALSTACMIPTSTSSSTSDNIDALRKTLLGMDAFSSGDHTYLQELGPDAPSAGENAVGDLVNNIQRAVMRSRPGNTGQPAMTDDVYKILQDYMVNKDQDFSKNCVLFEPADTNPLQTSLDTNIAQVASISEAITTANDEGDDQDAADEMDLRDDSSCPAVKRQGPTMSASTRDIVDACERAGLVMTNKGIQLVTHSDVRICLEPWQATAIAWMIDMEEQTPLRGGILADGCGLGKTRTTLALMERSLLKVPDDGTYYPQLVLCPKSLVDMWYTEVKDQFGETFTVKVFYGYPKKAPKSDRERCIIKSNAELLEFLGSLEPKCKTTGRVIIISSYDTFARRTTHRSAARETDPINLESDNESEEEEEPRDDPLFVPTEMGTDEWLDAMDTIEDSEPSSSEQGVTRSVKYTLGSQGSSTTAFAIQGLGMAQNNSMSSAAEYITRLTSAKFSRVICDEAHRVKNIMSRLHQSISLLDYNAIWFLTATPISSSFTDLNGPLSLLHKLSAADGQNGEQEADLPLVPGIKDRPDGGFDYLLDVYGRWSKLTKLPSPAPWGLLNPRLLFDLQGRRLTPAQACKVIPIIFRLCILQRHMGDTIDTQDGNIQIGGNIPPARVMTIELCYSDEEQRDHDLIYSKVVRGLTSTKEGECYASKLCPVQQYGTGRVNNGKLRRLCALAFHPKLDTFLNLEGILNTHNEHILEIAKQGNLCFELFWHLTANGRSNSIPRIKFDQARYLLCESPRLKYLLKIFLEEGLTPSSAKPRFVIFCNWPMTLWLVQMLLNALSLDFVSITSHMGVSDRTEAIDCFNDPNNNCSVFITTYSLGAFGLNLQNNCSRLILMESAINNNRIFHAIGRMHRLGQRNPQKIWFLFQDSTIQRWMEWNNLVKIRGQIAAQNREAFEPILRRRQEARDLEDISIDPKGEREGDIQDLCDRHFREMMGQEEGCADRNAMWNETDLDVVTKGRRHHSSRLGHGVNNMTRHGNDKANEYDEEKGKGKEKEPASEKSES
ncbi:SNF2-related protein [Penicillium odoratum]|uniref:SNF2-related protein n=1 Tax=Penicillium odoratum TaxID=1167516 RepID=UPI002547D359|nr:SNF2-related protein [Penicillium odoratum]KAJ5745350.1 SNF2-related protein [Penicillium odoratum]